MAVAAATIDSIPAGVRKTIKSIKEIVGNHTDGDIYASLKECNMDPNESVQKLLYQDTFHEVRGRRNKKKENSEYKDSVVPKKNLEKAGQDMKYHTFSDGNGRRGRSTESGAVRDNRVNHNAHINQIAMTSNISEKGSKGTALESQKPMGRKTFSLDRNGSKGSRLRLARNTKLSGKVNDSIGKPTDFERHNIRPNSSNSGVGVYSSSSDLVHVPSLDSSSSNAIKRDVEVVGVHKQSSESRRQFSNVESSFSKPIWRRNKYLTSESVRRFSSASKGNLHSQTLNNQYHGKSHQHPAGHQKVFQPIKEWKPKQSNTSSGKSDFPSANNPADKSTECRTEVLELQEKISQADTFENQNVVIAEHIRVTETNCGLLTFGSIGPYFQAVCSTGESKVEPSASLLVPTLESPKDDILGSKQHDKQDDHVVVPDSQSTVTSVEHQSLENKESQSPQNYADIGIVPQNNQFYSLSESQQQKEATELPSLLVSNRYDSQSGYDVPYFTPTMEEFSGGQGLPYSQEAFTSYAPNSIPAASTIPMMQQQQQPMPQMYPQQLHASHFANLMPYRPFLSPLYVPTMGVPGYSNNTLTYPPHPSNGASGYVLMPGGNSHLNAANMKYGAQQFKPYPGFGPTGFENFTAPIGYNMNGQGVGTATGAEDPSRLQHKDVNMYASNPQADQSQAWIQSSRGELHQGMQQSTPYYNMVGQQSQSPYFASHTGQATFNGGPAQSTTTHLQYSPGMYHNHPQQITAAAPGPQVAAYQQQPQTSHFNRIPNS